MHNRRIGGGALLSLALSIGAAATVDAAESFTIQLRDATETVAIFNPCFGPAIGELTYDGVLHITENDTGEHAVINVRGASQTFPLNPSVPPFSGRFSEHQVLNLNRNNVNTTFVVTQHDDRGMAFHITFHVTLTPGGAELSVLNFSCGL